MATAEFGTFGAVTTPVVPSHPAEEKKVEEAPTQLHRVRTVRLQQGVSLRSAARQMGSDIRSLRLQEQESTDLRISDLHKWQKALDVPLTDLVEETDEPLSRPVMERARMIRLMKTAAAIHERAPVAIQRMSQMLVDQLVEVMPELKDVSPWHQFGQRRSLDDYGQVVERRLSEDAIYDRMDDD
jgi:transcriptional regulator with XRE-family HTH domain